MRDAQVLEYRLHPFNRAQRGKKRSANPRLQLGRKLLGDCASQRLIMLEHRSHASSKKQIERLIDAKIDAIRGQRFRKTATTQHFAIDQYAVAVENDEIWPDHRGFPFPIRAYTHTLGNNPLFVSRLSTAFQRSHAFRAYCLKMPPRSRIFGTTALSACKDAASNGESRQATRSVDFWFLHRRNRARRTDSLSDFAPSARVRFAPIVFSNSGSGCSLIPSRGVSKGDGHQRGRASFETRARARSSG